MTTLVSRFATVDELLDDARSRLPRHLEWRLHPDSTSRLPQARRTQQWIVLCSEGYTSSLAADALNSLGIAATDVGGGFDAWRAAGLPTVAGSTPAHQLVSESRR